MDQADTLKKIMTNHAAEPRPNSINDTPLPRVICISSGKGGVGKTNVATNLAYSLAQKKKKVLLLDADLNLANVDVLLGLTPKFNLHHVFTEEKKLTDVLVKGPGGFWILPASSGVMEMGDLTEDQKLFFLSEMENLGQDIDIMIIDTAAGINNNVIYFNLGAQERIIVLTPEPTSLTDAYALIKVLSTRHDIKKFRILVNVAKNEKEALSVYRKLSMVADRFLETLSLDYLGYIPYDQKLPDSVRKQKLISEIYPKSTASQMLKNIATQISEEEVNPQPDGNIKFIWRDIFRL